MTTILGLNAYHADSAACLVRDGVVVAAAEEERFRRVKHWAGLPTEAVRYCLDAAGTTLAEVNHVAINRDPKANLLKKALFTLGARPSVELVAARLRNAGEVRSPVARLAAELGEDPAAARARLHPVEHHLAHLSSAFHVSPHARAAVVAIDGFGDFASAMWGVGRDAEIEIRDRVLFPHSLGLLYQAITQFLGFWSYGDEYKVMGLAPYGEPTLLHAFDRIAHVRSDGGYELDLDYFRHHADGVEMVWDGGAPRIGRIFGDRLEELLGPPRAAGDEITPHHRAIAASMQAFYERAFLRLLGRVREETGETALCLAGGCAMNSVANGKVLAETGFRELYVPPAPGDAGGAVGAAFAVWHGALGRPRGYVMADAYLGPEFGEDAVWDEIQRQPEVFAAEGCDIRRFDDEGALCSRVAQALADGQVVGWFQGRMEWGPRALGARSILADPRRDDMKDILNAKIKRRESFRPFAPSILRERVAEWFETDDDAPFMERVFRIRPERRKEIPAVCHVDGTGRPQTVARAQNPRFHRLISAFAALTEVPAVLNTSFNENEPIVRRPSEAIDCFLRTRMDMLVLGDMVISR